MGEAEREGGRGDALVLYSGATPSTQPGVGLRRCDAIRAIRYC